MQESASDRDGRHREGHLLPGLRAALRHGRDGRGRRADQAPARPRPSAVRRLRLPEGDRDGRGPERPRPRAAPAAPAARRLVRAGHLGRGARRDRRAAEARSSTAHGGDSVGWYMGNPGAFSYSHPLWVKGFLDALGSPHSYTASSQDVSNRFAASSLPLRLAVHRPDPRPRANRLPARRRRQPARLARQRAQRAAGQGPAPRDHRPRRPGGRRRPAPLGDRARVRARRDRSRRRRLAAALDARGDLRRGARGPRGDRAPVDAASRRCARSSPSFPPEATEAAPACRPRGPRARPRPRRAPSAPPSTGAPARAWAATARWSRSCSTRSTLVTGNLDREGGAMFGDPPIDFSRIADLVGLGTYVEGPLAGRRPARGARLAAGVGDGEGDDDAGQGPDPGDVRLRRQPGALGARTATSSRRRWRSSSSRSRSTSTSPTPRATATTCSRRRRCTSARTSRCRSWPCSRRRSSR